MNSSVELHDCLKQELALAKLFIELLERENQALLNPADDQALTEAIEQKNLHAEKLVAIGVRREEALAALGLPCTREGLQNAANQHPDLAPTLAELMQVASQAAELNAANGQIIDTFIAHNQQTLESLRNLMGEGTIYDARGRTHPGGKGARRNIKAG